MLHLLQSIDFEKIVNSGIGIVLVASLFFFLLNIAKNEAKEDVEKYDFDEEEIYK